MPHKRRNWIIGLSSGAVVVTSGFMTLAGGAEKYDALNLPRWAWRSEVVQVAEEQAVTKLDVLEIQKKLAEDKLLDAQLVKSDYELQKKPVPQFIADSLKETEQLIADIESQIIRIKTQAAE